MAEPQREGVPTARRLTTVHRPAAATIRMTDRYGLGPPRTHTCTMQYSIPPSRPSLIRPRTRASSQHTVSVPSGISSCSCEWHALAARTINPPPASEPVPGHLPRTQHPVAPAASVSKSARGPGGRHTRTSIQIVGLVDKTIGGAVSEIEIEIPLPSLYSVLCPGGIVHTHTQYSCPMCRKCIGYVATRSIGRVHRAHAGGLIHTAILMSSILTS